MDVVGCLAEEACEQLREAGYHVRVVTTGPPWDCQGSGRVMVIRQRELDAKEVELLVAHERYLRKTPD